MKCWGCDPSNPESERYMVYYPSDPQVKEGVVVPAIRLRGVRPRGCRPSSMKCWGCDPSNDRLGRRTADVWSSSMKCWGCDPSNFSLIITCPDPLNPQ